MVEKPIHSGFCAIHQVDDAFGQSGFFEEFVNVPHGERNALAGLEDESVAGSYRIRQIPECDHAGKVEGHDCCGDSERLADHHFIDAAGNVLEVVALHHHRNTAGDFDVFDGAAHFGFGFGKGLAVYLRDDASDVVDVIFEQHLQFEQRLNAVFGRSAAPFGKGGGGSFDGFIDFSGVAERNLRENLAGGGIDYVAPFVLGRTGGGACPLAVDEVWNAGDRRSGDGGHEFTFQLSQTLPCISRIPCD